MRLDDKGKIIKYIFSSSLDKWANEYKIMDRKKKTSTWYGLCLLIKIYEFYDLKIHQWRKSKLLKQSQYQAVIWCLDLGFKEFDEVLEMTRVSDALKLGFDVEEYKMHHRRVWEFIKLKVKIDAQIKKFTYKYDNIDGRRKGKFFCGKTIQKLKGNSAELLHLSIKNRDELAWDDVGSDMSNRVCQYLRYH